MLMPKRTKYRKQMKGRIKGNATRGTTVAFGDYGLQACEPARITSRQIETCRVVMNRTFKRTGKVFIRIFPDKPITKKPAEVRMGKGKGNVELWVAPVKPGRIMFEVSGVTEELAKKALKKASYKLPIKVKFVKKGGEQ